MNRREQLRTTTLTNLREHGVLMQIGQSGVTQLLATIHSECGTVTCQRLTSSGFEYTTRPPTIVAATAPLSDHPSNGVFFDFERSAEA